MENPFEIKSLGDTPKSIENRSHQNLKNKQAPYNFSRLFHPIYSIRKNPLKHSYKNNLEK
jgi:hypothetical protein